MDEVIKKLQRNPEKDGDGKFPWPTNCWFINTQCQRISSHCHPPLTSGRTPIRNSQEDFSLGTFYPPPIPFSALFHYSSTVHCPQDDYGLKDTSNLLLRLL